MNEATLHSLEAEIRARTGIDIGEERRGDLRRAVERLADSGQGRHAEALADVLTNGPASSLVAELVSAVTINETHFWRTPQQFEALRSEVFPELAVGRRTPIRVWSAACSTGPEPYSIVMAADAAAVLAQPGLRVDATDVDEGALRLAREARYGTWAMRGVGGDMRRRWFTTETDGAVRPLARLRAVVDFSIHSVLDRRTAQPYDVILCRNVLIYFDVDTRQRVVDNLFDALVPGGLLLVAPAEMQTPLFERFEPAVFASGALGYRRPGGDRPPHRSWQAPSPSVAAPPPLIAPSASRSMLRPTPAPARSPRPVPATVRPEDPEVSEGEQTVIRIRHGLALLDEDDGQAAVRVLREAAVLAPDSADAHAALALALLHEQAFQRAGAAAKRALLLLGDQAETTEAGRHAVVVLGTVAALEDGR